MFAESVVCDRTEDGVFAGSVVCERTEDGVCAESIVCDRKEGGVFAESIVCDRKENGVFAGSVVWTGRRMVCLLGQWYRQDGGWCVCWVSGINRMEDGVFAGSGACDRTEGGLFARSVVWTGRRMVRLLCQWYRQDGRWSVCWFSGI